MVYTPRVTFTKALRFCVWLALLLIAGVVVDAAVCLDCPSEPLSAGGEDHEGESSVENGCSLCLCRVVDDSLAVDSVGLWSTTASSFSSSSYGLLLPSSLEHPPQQATFLTAA